MKQPAVAEFKIDQALHGYRHGHRLLASSTELSGDAETSMLALSDLLTSDDLPRDVGYLSAYPLKSINRYALTRTWRAPEAPRPGSVWSHSLIFDYSILTVLDDLALLLPLFQRPTGEAFTWYARPIEGLPASPRPVDNIQSKLDASTAQSRAIDLYRQLYSPRPSPRIFLEASALDTDEALAVGIWRQMWPGLRRDFAFFTRAAGEVNDVSASCRLVFRTDEFIAPDSGGTEADEAAYQVLADDLPKRKSELRDFLARYAIDTPKPRASVAGLTLVHQSSSDSGKLATKIANTFARGTFPRLKRDILLRVISEKNADATEKAIRAFRDEKLKSAGNELSELVEADRIGTPVLFERYIRAAAPSEPDTLGYVVTDLLLASTPENVLISAQLGAELKHRLLKTRPTIVRLPKFWERLARHDRASLIEDALSLSIPAASLLAGLTPELETQEAAALLAAGGAKIEDELVSLLRSGQLRDGQAIGDLVVRRSGVVARAIANKRPIGLVLLEQFAAARLKGLTGDLAAPVWLKGLAINAPGVRAQADTPALAVCLLEAAGNASGGLRADLFEAAFDGIYAGLTNYQFDYELREELERILGRERKEWHLVDKLVAAAVDLYGGAETPSHRLLYVTSDRQRLDHILRRIRDKAGRTSLLRLKERAKQRGGQDLGWRLAAIDQLTAARPNSWLWF